MTHSKISRSGLVLISSLIFGLIPGLFSTNTKADMSDEDYQSALALAQKKVSRQKNAGLTAQSLNPQSLNARSASLIRNPFGRVYQVGDRWEVAAWSFQNTMARMTTDPSQLQIKGGQGGIFQYEVKNVQGSGTSQGQVQIQVTQLEAFGVKKTDARVKMLKFILDDQGTQARKIYQIEDRAGQSHDIPVSPDGIHSAITRLELFPLDIPDLATAERTTASFIPALPDGLQAIATQAGFHPNPATATSYEQDDFFGRGIQAIWEQGDPWPAYFKNSNGVSILIHKGAS